MLVVFLTICLTRSFFKASRVKSYVNQGELESRSSSLNARINVENSEETKFVNEEEQIEMCKKCEKFRFRRTHHCSVCNVCIDRMDHHCFVLNNCIGKNNYFYFVSYLFLVTVLSGVMSFITTWILYLYYGNVKINHQLRLWLTIFNFPVRCCILWLLSSIVFIMVGYFFYYHLKLILYDRTTIELKYKISYNKDKQEETEKLTISNKFKLLHTNLLNVIRSTSLFDLFWPD